MANKFRIPTTEEWVSLVKMTNGDDAVIHCKRAQSFCYDPKTDGPNPQRVRAWLSNHYSFNHKASARMGHVGFRPVFEIPEGMEQLKDGDSVVIGTLYMNGLPVRMADNIEAVALYIPDSVLEFREAIKDVAYQVRAIKCGSVLICDRNVVRGISLEDILGQINGFEKERTYIAVISSTATRDTQVYTGTNPDADPLDENAWADIENAEVFLGTFAGTKEEALAEAAEYGGVAPEFIHLIEI